MNKKIIIGIVFVALLAGSILFFTLQEKEPEPIVIGGVLPLTGAASQSGQNTLDGISLAIEEINARGGINGRLFELVVGDSQSTPEGGIQAFNKIESEHHPLFYIESTSSLGRAISPLAEEAEVVLIASATDPKIIEGRKWVFKNFPSPKNEILPLTQIVDRLESESIAILYLDDEFGLSIYNPLEAIFEEQGRQVKGIPFITADFDYTEEIKELEETEVVIVIGFLGHFIEIFSQLSRSNYSGNIVASSDGADLVIFNLPEAEGAYFATSNVFRSDYLFVQELKNKYDERHKDGLFGNKFSNSYEIAYIVSDLLKNEEKITRDSLRKALDSGFTYSGVFGVITVSPGDHDFGYPLFAAQIVNGSLEYL